MTRTDSLTATAPLTRFALRRDRVRIVVWIAGIVLLVVATVGSIKGLYPNQAELDKAARASEGNAAAIIFNWTGAGSRHGRRAGRVPDRQLRVDPDGLDERLHGGTPDPG